MTPLGRSRGRLVRLFASLRVRTLVLVLLAVLPALVLSYNLIREERRLVAREVQQGALRMARATAADQERVIEASRQLLIALAQLPELQRAEPEACSRNLARLLPQFPTYTNLGAALPDGTVFCSALPLPGRVSIADRDYFLAATRSRGFAASGVQIPRIGGRPAMHLGYPIVGAEGELRGVVFAALNLIALSRETARTDLPEGSTFLVLDRDGVVLARYPDPERWIGRSVEETDLAQVLLAAQEGTAEVVGLDGVDRLYGFTSVRGALGAATGLSVAVGIPAETAFVPVDRMHRTSILLLLLASALVLAAAWVGGEYFVLRPVRALVGATRRLAAGDLTARTGVRYGIGPGELAALARSFDDMAASLESRARELAAVSLAARSVVQERELVGTAGAVVAQARAALHTDHAVLWRVDEQSRELRLLAHLGLPEAAVRLFETVPFDAPVPAARAARTGRPVIVEDMHLQSEPDEERRLAQETGARSTLDLPLAYRGRLVGVLAVSTVAPHRFGPEELRLASALGDLFAAAVENARLYGELTEALRLRDEFLGAAAHELRTPATVLKAHAQILGRDEGDEQHRRLLAGIQGAAARTARLARELLEAHTLTRAPEHLHRRSADLRALVVAAAENAGAASPRHRFVVCAGGPVPCEVDRDRLSLATDALLENAARYQPSGGVVRVTVSADGGEGTVEVRDSGVGIRPERLGYVFEPLFEPWPPGSPHYVGVVGMGLHLARRIVEAHGGTIEAESRLGEGSAFRFRIPLHAAAGRGADDGEPSREERPTRGREEAGAPGPPA